MRIAPEELKRREKEFLWNPWNDSTNPSPDWINPQGGKFWLDPSMTNYARTKQVSHTTLPAIDGYVYCVELLDDTKTRVLYIGQDPVDESSSYETMCGMIDKHKLAKKFE